MRPFLRSTNYLGCYCTSPTRLQILSFGHGNGLSPVWWLENKAGLSPIYRIPCPIFSHEPESDNGRFLQYLSGSVYAKFHFLLAGFQFNEIPFANQSLDEISIVDPIGCILRSLDSSHYRVRQRCNTKFRFSLHPSASIVEQEFAANCSIQYFNFRNTFFPGRYPRYGQKDNVL